MESSQVIKFRVPVHPEIEYIVLADTHHPKGPCTHIVCIWALKLLYGNPFTRSVLGILFTFWVMGFLIYKQKGSFFLPRGTGIKFKAQVYTK